MEREVGVFEKLHKLTENSKAKEIQPEYLVINKEGELFLPVKETANLMDLSTSRVLALVSENRLKAIKPTGWENYILVQSAIDYLDTGRKQSGRPRKK